MARTKISEFSATPGNNTDIDGINIAEGCAPSGINDAIRELMSQLKDFQAGDAGDSITVVGTLAAKGTSTAAADLKLYENTTNGTNYVGFISPANVTANVQWTLPSADGSSGQALQTNGSGTLSFTTLGISAGGTGQTTANAAFNALAPSQTGNSGKYLTTDGTNTSWATNPLGTVTSVAMTVPSFLSVSGSPITSSGTLAVSLSGTALPTANGGTGLTSFTANGVVYASSTSALTTGSALTFDGSVFKVAKAGGVAGTSNLVYVDVTSSYGGVTLNSVSGQNCFVELYQAGTTKVGEFGIDAANSLVNIGGFGSYNTRFYASGSEQMRLTSSLFTVVPGATIQGITVGRGAGAVSTNTAVGASAINGTSYSNSTAVGYQALYTGGGGTETALGSQALYTSGGSAGFNTAVGYRSLYLNSSGLYNVAMGVQALNSNTTASNNTAVGYQAGFSNTTGTQNTFVGNQAGYSTTGSYNTLLGHQSGYNLTSGTINTFLGINAGLSMTTGSKNTILGSYSGNQGGLDIRTSSNQVVISDGDGNPRIYVNGNGDLMSAGATTNDNTTYGFKVQVNSGNTIVKSVGDASTNGNDTFHVYSTGAGAYRFYVGYGGTISATSTTISAISDQRFKENIQDLDVGLDAIMALKPRKFDWKQGKGKDIKGDRGFIAQEFEQVFPDLIDEWKDPAPEGETPYKAVRADLIPILVKAIQELKAEFDAYKASHP